MDAVELAIREHLPLVATVAAGLRRDLRLPPGVGDDLESAGREGLVRAAQRFDPSRGVPFGAFAHHRIRWAMLDGLRRESELPRHVHRRLMLARAAARAGEAATEDLAEGPRSPRDADLALARHLAGMATAMGVALVVAPRGEDEPPELVDLSISPEEAVVRKNLGDLVRRIADELPPPQGAILLAHAFEDRSLEDVASEHGISKSWACRLLARAVDVVRERLAD